MLEKIKKLMQLKEQSNSKRYAELVNKENPTDKDVEELMELGVALGYSHDKIREDVENVNKLKSYIAMLEKHEKSMARLKELEGYVVPFNLETERIIKEREKQIADDNREYMSLKSTGAPIGKLHEMALFIKKNSHIFNSEYIIPTYIPKDIWDKYMDGKL